MSARQKLFVPFVFFLITSIGFSQMETVPIFTEPFNDEQTDGIDGKAIITGITVAGNEKKGVFKSYAGNGKINLEKGTVCFWVKPVDWKPDDNKAHIFFEAFGNNSRLLIYKYKGKNNSLGFIFGPLKEVDGRPQWAMANTPVENWQPGEWHFIACSWDKKEIRLYVDGNLENMVRLKNFPESPFTSFYVGGRNPEKWTDTVKGITLIDELKIFREPLSLEQIHAEWRKYNNKLQSKIRYPVFSLRSTDNPPVTDGIIGEREYSVKTTGFLGIWDQKYASEQSFVYMSRDSKKLYLAVSTPVSDNLSANIYGKDNVNIWQDDSIEIYLNSGSNDQFHFIVNSIGTLYDSKNGELSWNSDFDYINKIENGVWSLEMGIPFDKLGVPSPDEGSGWRFNICRTFTSTGAYTSLSPVRRAYGDAVAFSEMVFTDKTPLMHLNSIGDISSGALDFKFCAAKNTGYTGNANLNAVLEIDKISEEKKKILEGKTAEISMKKEGMKGEGTFTFEAFTEDNRKLFFQRIPFSAQSGDPLKLLYFYRLPESQTIRFGLQQNVLSEGGKFYSVCISLSDKNGKTVFEKKFQPESFKYELETDISSVLPGTYNLNIAFLRPSGQKIFENSENFIKYPAQTPWSGNKTGITDEVPPPWTPMTVNENTVACWGRKYEFNEGVLPSQIISQGSPMLKSPVHLKAEINGNKLTDRRTSLSWTENEPAKAVLDEKGILGPFEITAEIKTEYDGFMWFVINLKSEVPVKVDKLCLEIPFLKDSATLINLGDDRVKKGTGSLPDKGISKNLKTEKPILWAGNEKTGLQWFAETLRNWTLENPEKSAEIIPRKEDVLLKFNIIDTPVTLMGKTEIAFGLMATPAKALPPDWRKLRPSGTSLKRNIFFWGMSADRMVTPLFNYFAPAPENVDKIREILKGYEARGEKSLSYCAFAVLSPYCPEFMWQGELWKKIPGPRAIQWDDKNNARADSFVWICPNCPDYRDFYCYTVDKAVRELGLNGLYFDFGWTASCSNQLHGCGWKNRKGEMELTFNILGTRELAKRIYVLMKTYKPDSKIAYHMSGVIEMPVHSFADILLDGETLTRCVADESSYYDLLPLDVFRAEFMQHQWGAVTVILSEFVRSAELFRNDMKSYWWSEKAEKPMNHLIGLVIVHDSKCFMSDTYKYLSKVRDAQDKFGWDENVEFLPYWNNSEYIKIISPVSKNIVISAFKRNDKLMLVPFNNTDTDNDLVIELDFNRLNVTKVVSVKDALNEEKYTIEKNTIKVPMKSRAFKILTTE